MVCLQSLHSVGVVTISFITSWYALSCLVPSICYLTWFLFAFVFFFLILHGVCVVGIMDFFGGGSYSSVYVPPPLCVFPLVLMMCIPTFFSVMFCMPISSFTYSPGFLLFQLCVFVHAWMKTFGGCVHMHHMQPYMCLEICMLNILCYNLIPLARIVMLSMWYFDIVSVLACHSICILFLYVSIGHIVCHFCIFVICHMYQFWYMICHLSLCIFINANHTGMV